MKNNKENITNITEEFRDSCNYRVNNGDASEYKWELVGDNQNEPTQVHFYKEDMNEKLSVSLSNIFDMWLRHYKNHLEEEERDKERKVLDEIQDKKRKVLREKLDELMESYEMFIKQKTKVELHERMTNVEHEEDEDLKFTLTNIRDVLDGNFISHYDKGIHFGNGNRKQNSIWIEEEWYLENYDKLKQIILSLCPDYEPPPSPSYENKYGFKFMRLENQNMKGSYSQHYDYFLRYADELTMEGFYDKLIDLHRKMKKEKIGYWKS